MITAKNQEKRRSLKAIVKAKQQVFLRDNYFSSRMRVLLQIKNILHISSGVLYNNWNGIFLCMIRLLLFVLQVHTIYMNI